MLSVHQERQVGTDNCVRYGGRVLQIPPPVDLWKAYRALFSNCGRLRTLSN
jgi:hypothetical protein